MSFNLMIYSIGEGLFKPYAGQSFQAITPKESFVVLTGPGTEKQQQLHEMIEIAETNPEKELDIKNFACTNRKSS